MPVLTNRAVVSLLGNKRASKFDPYHRLLESEVKLYRKEGITYFKHKKYAPRCHKKDCAFRDRTCVGPCWGYISKAQWSKWERCYLKYGVAVTVCGGSNANSNQT